MCACQCVHTLELVPGVDDSHVCRYGVESTAPYDVYTFFSCLAVVVQLHSLQKLHAARHTQICKSKNRNAYTNVFLCAC